MKLLAPITALIAAASAGQIYTGQSAEGYAQSAEQYQSGLEYQQRGLYSHQSQAPQVFEGHESTYSSRPTGEKSAKILAYDMENDGHQYKYAYETENGIKVQEAGQTSEHGTVAHGAYSYTGDDGHTYTVTYTADENGFHPQGDHLPTPPPVPEAILKSLEQNARDEAAGIYDDGKYKEHASQGEDHGYQHYEANYQPHGFQAASGHDSGAELAYHGHATPAPMSHTISGHISSHVQTGHSLPSHGYSSGQAHSGHSSGAELAYHAQPIHVSSGHTHGADLAYRAHSGYLHSGHALAPEMAYHGHH